MADNIYDRLDELLEQNEELFEQNEELLRRQEQAEKEAKLFREEMRRRQQSESTATSSQGSTVEALRAFVGGSVQEFLWYGLKEDFHVKKRRAALCLFLSVLLMLATTAASVVCFKTYSTYTLFENICLLLLCYLASYVLRAKKEHEACDFLLHTYLRTEHDELGMLRIGKKKTRYKVFFSLGYLSALLNMHCVFSLGGLYPWLLITLEVLSWSVTTVALCFVGQLFSCYGTVLRFSNIRRGMTLIYDTVVQRVYRAQSYYQRLPFMDPNL